MNSAAAKSVKTRIVEHYKSISFVFFVIFCLYIFGAGVIRPVYNWDLVAYVACAIKDNKMTDEEIHKETWRLIEENIPEVKVNDLINKSQRRRIWYDHYEGFMSLLPMYEVKLGYIGAIKFLSIFYDPITSILIISIVTSVVISIIFFMVTREIDGILTFLWLPLLCLSGIFKCAMFGTPDGLATCLYLLAIVLILEKRTYIGAIFLLLGLSARPDNLVLNLSFALMFFFHNKKFGIILGFASILCFYFISMTTEHVGWWKHFAFTFYPGAVDLNKFNSPFDISSYIKTLLLSLYLASLFVWPYYLLLIGILSSNIVFQNINRETFSLRDIFEKQFYFSFFVLISLLGSTFAHFLIFPLVRSRTYLPTIFGVGIVLLYLIQFSQKRSLAKSE